MSVQQTEEGRLREAQAEPKAVGKSKVPGSLGRCPARGSGNPLQGSCLKNPMDREAWRATAQEVSKSQVQLNTHGVSFLPVAYVLSYVL